MATNCNPLPKSGLVRVNQICGNPKADPPIPPILPISKTSWWNGVRSGKYPAPIKLGPRTTCWKAEDIRRLIDAGIVGSAV
ncbi:MAG: AlpA family phage regulatory protein [Candidatus Competibacteraceae bacterium]|nr:AlpA family phage regulatory protein [Candidatus Competibacteraceae bacterium]